MHPMTSDNIRCRENKVGLSSDSRELDRLGITKYGNAALINRVVNVSAMMNHRGFFVLIKGDYALWRYKRACRSWARYSLVFSLSSINSHSLKFLVKVVQYYRKFRFDSRTSENRAFDITICIANRY